MADREEVFRLLEERSGKLPFILAIDGRCASGKTTLAGELQKRQACNVIHLDDFYLPRLRSVQLSRWQSRVEI